MEARKVDKPKVALKKLKHAASRLTAQPLKFRVTLSELTAENLGSGAKKAFFSWIRGGKELASDHADVEDGKCEWPCELSQVVTIYFQVGEGNLKATRKAYSLKVKDSRTNKTLGKVKVDLNSYCKLESQFNRAFVELKTTSRVNLFFVISTELVDEGSDGEPSPSPVDSDSRRCMSAAEEQGSLRGDKGSAGSRQLSSSLQDIPYTETGAGAEAALAVSSPSLLIQQSIEILHSSSDEEAEEASRWGKLKEIARRLTPKPPRQGAGPGHQRRNTAPAIAWSDPAIARSLFETPKSEAKNPFGEIEEEAGAAEGGPVGGSPNCLRTLRQERDLLESQLQLLREESAVLKKKMARAEEEAEASRGRLRSRVEELEGENRRLRRAARSGAPGGERESEGSVANNTAATAHFVSPRKDDMIEELIETKMRLAQTQTALDELRREVGQ